ncbi:MAG: radical SAM protein [archaeon GB-1867-097]|nr:radical SAM protein [Candidatus Culexmicrobium thermophilum]MCS7384704.1 radical SAM protein [Candidatus Culexmicrobium thermophilum]HDO21168.1 radical SAM protein [Candidatus Bathyarchaeota archaeon]
MLINELNTVKKNLRDVALSFALCYPSFYRIGISSLAVHLLYELLNSRGDVACERFFYDNGLPLKSMESALPLNRFDVLGFSLQYELDYISFLKMLLEGEIPVYSSSRGDDDPLVIVGGSAVTANPEPISAFADAIVIGEVEPILDDLVEILAGNSNSRKMDILEELSTLPGLYVPLVKRSVRRIFAEDLDSAFHSLRQVIPNVNSGSRFYPILGRSFLLEISRGCAFGCRFCLLGYNALPMRFRSFEKLKTIIDRGLKYTPVGKISIIGSAASAHPELIDICKYIVSSGFKLSISSLRVDYADEDMLKMLVNGGQRTVTFAPESASSKLLGIIGKGFQVEDVLEAAKAAGKAGFKQIKLYFMLGLPGESLSDIAEIVKLVKRITNYGFNGLRSIRLTFSPFVPKAGTPFQWFGVEEPSILKSKFNLLKMHLKGDSRFDLRFPRLREIYIQSFLSRSDSTVAPILLRVAELGGGLGAWRRVEKEFNFSIVNRAVSNLNLNADLPWDHIDRDFPKSLLLKELKDSGLNL